MKNLLSKLILWKTQFGVWCWKHFPKTMRWAQYQFSIETEHFWQLVYAWGFGAYLLCQVLIYGLNAYYLDQPAYAAAAGAYLMAAMFFAIFQMEMYSKALKKDLNAEVLRHAARVAAMQDAVIDDLREQLSIERAPKRRLPYGS